MILDELRLHNFGVYRGLHNAVLTPVAGRPIVLFGALNGSGKTTFLEAMQLALYGRATGLRGRGAYPDYLLRSINRYVAPSEGAGVGLTFRYWIDGKLTPVRLERTWHRSGKSVKETFEVWREERFDSVATERWSEFVEEIIPHQIAHLFFFDGEKIEGLADPAQSSALLRVGLHSLLGLDLVDHLVKSLGIVERRGKTSQLDSADQAAVKMLEEEIAGFEVKRQAIGQKLAEINTQIDQRGNEIQRLEKQFELAGGDLFARRKSIESEYESLKHERMRMHAELVLLAGGDAPLLLIASFADDLGDIVAESSERLSESKFAKLIQKRDREVLRKLKELEVSKAAVESMKRFLEESRSIKKHHGSVPDEFLPTSLPGWPDHEAVRNALSRSLDGLKSVDKKIATCERNLSAVPEEDAVKSILEALMSAKRELERTNVRKGLLEEELAAVVLESRRKEGLRRAKLERAAEEQLASSTKLRILKHSERARATLGTYREVIAQRHMANLERLISKCFAQLHRKKSLKYSIEINRNTYELMLREAAGHLVEAAELSAGERQLLAVSVLWALAQASGRKLPTIIDTPLGRLDGPHRHFLVDNYFPFASHQVILLSTDEEVTPSYRRRLSPAIGREYSIVFNEAERTSKIVDGYFDEALAA